MRGRISDFLREKEGYLTIECDKQAFKNYHRFYKTVFLWSSVSIRTIISNVLETLEHHVWKPCVLFQ